MRNAKSGSEIGRVNKPQGKKRMNRMDVLPLDDWAEKRQNFQQLFKLESFITTLDLHLSVPLNQNQIIL